jgi:hypothetical protein
MAIGIHIVHSVIWYILWPFGNYGVVLVYLPSFGILYYEKSGNPAAYVCQAWKWKDASGRRSLVSYAKPFDPQKRRD